MAETTNGHSQYIGTRTIRPDGVDKVTGRARFGADFNLPSQLIESVLRSPQVRVSADRPFVMYADGDPIADLPCTVRARRRALRVLAPA